MNEYKERVTKKDRQDIKTINKMIKRTYKKKSETSMRNISIHKKLKRKKYVKVNINMNLDRIRKKSTKMSMNFTIDINKFQ